MQRNRSPLGYSGFKQGGDEWWQNAGSALGLAPDDPLTELLRTVTSVTMSARNKII